MTTEMDKDFNNITRVKEVFILSLIIALQIILNRQWLVSKEAFISHDTARFYGVFAYFFDNLLNGRLPLWNPYMNCGEPFFLCINILRLWDPSTLFLVLLLKFRLLNASFIHLYQIDLFIRYIIFVIGGYYFFRYILKHRISAMVGFVTLAFSPIDALYLRQHGFLHTSCYLPWILLSLLRILEKREIHSYILLAFLLGIAIPAYNSMYIISFMLIFIIFVFLARSVSFKISYFIKDYRAVIFCLLIFALVSLNIIPMMKHYMDSIVPMGKVFVTNKANSGPMDFMGLFLPNYFIDGFIKYFYNFQNRGASEAYLYIGILPLIFLFIGIFYSDNKYKMAFLYTTILLIFLMLGILYPLLCNIIPFFNIIRNMHTFCYFFLFCLCYFVGTGVDLVVDIDSSKEYPGSGFLARPIFIIQIVIILVCLSFIISIYRDFPIDLNILTRIIYFLLFLLLSFLFFNKLILDKEISINRKMGVIIVLILFDLLISSDNVSSYATTRDTRVFSKLPRSVQAVEYPVNRLMTWRFNDDISNIFSYEPLVYKKHVAVTRIDPPDSYFLELKDYYNLKHGRIPSDVIDVIMGITQPMIRLIKRCVVIEHDKILDKLRSVDSQIVKNVVFIEEPLPLQFRHLAVELDKTGKDDNGAVIGGTKPSLRGGSEATDEAISGEIASFTAFTRNDTLSMYSPNNRHITKDVTDLGDIDVLDYSENKVILTVDAREDALLYFSDGYDKYWKAYIDGIATKIYRANLNFKAVLIGKGSHKVQFIYDPKFYRYSIVLYIILVALFIMVIPIL